MSTENTVERNFNDYVEDLKNLIRIPSVSFAGFPASEPRRSATAVAELLKKRGLENVQILEVPGAHPYVYGERLKAPGKPTVLLYAHHDVQPPGRPELWKSPAFEPTLRQGPGGERLYGRGSADDKAGVIVHAASIAALLEARGELPVNVRVVIEGEEESGSSHLSQFIKQYKNLLKADVIVLADSGNFDIGVPAMTIGLRGMVVAEVEVRTLNKTVHSGMWGGPIPDPVIALSKMLAKLVDDEGRIAIPGVREQVRPLSQAEAAEYGKIPFDEAAFREQSGMIPGARILNDGFDPPNPLAQIWRFPSLTVTAIQASERKQPANIINDTAWARVTIRLVPDMDPRKVAEQLTKYLHELVPWGLELTVKCGEGSGPWSIDPHDAKNQKTAITYGAAKAAMKRGYGKEPLYIGCGGSIPFVKPFAEALGGAPALIVGVEDPYTNAHGENESVLLSDLKKGVLSQIYLFEELAEKWPRK